MASLFVSHSSQDARLTAELVGWLRAAGFQALFVDFDPDFGIPAGRSWERELYAQLRRADGECCMWRARPRTRLGGASRS